MLLVTAVRTPELHQAEQNDSAHLDSQLLLLEGYSEVTDHTRAKVAQEIQEADVNFRHDFTQR